MQRCTYPWRFYTVNVAITMNISRWSFSDLENNLRKLTFKSAWIVKAFIVLEDPGVGASRDWITLKTAICADLRESQVDCLYWSLMNNPLSTSMPLSVLPVVGDVFTHASAAGVRVVLTSSQIGPTPRLAEAWVLEWSKSAPWVYTQKPQLADRYE